MTTKGETTLEILPDETFVPGEGEHQHYLRVRVYGCTGEGTWLTASDGVLPLTRAHAQPDVDENDQAAVPEALFDRLMDAFPEARCIGYEGEELDPDDEAPAILDETYAWTCSQKCGVDPM